MRGGEDPGMRPLRRILVLAFALALVGCGPAARRPASTTTATPTAAAPPPSATASATAPATHPAPATSPNPAATASAAATTTATAPPMVLGPGFGQPDDVAVAPDGTIYFSDFAGGRIGRMPPGGGRPTAIAHGLSDPEGIVVLPGGSLAVAQQGRNDIVRIDPATGAVTSIAAVPNHTDLLGVDGLGWDPATQSLLVPDSPNGRLLAIDPRSGASRVLIPGGLGRPTDAMLLPSGGYGIVDETGGRVLLGGTVAARLTQPDDIVAADGRIYVNALSGAIWEVAPRVRQVLGGLANPQGMAAAPDGSLVIVDQGRNRLLRWRP